MIERSIFSLNFPRKFSALISHDVLHSKLIIVEGFYSGELHGHSINQRLKTPEFKLLIGHTEHLINYWSHDKVNLIKIFLPGANAKCWASNSNSAKNFSLAASTRASTFGVSACWMVNDILNFLNSLSGTFVRRCCLVVDRLKVAKDWSVSLVWIHRAPNGRVFSSDFGTPDAFSSSDTESTDRIRSIVVSVLKVVLYGA